MASDHQPEQRPVPQPDETVSVLWCPAGGRDDRVDVLRDRHHPWVGYPKGKGGMCPGRPVTLTYTLTAQAER